MKTFRRIFCLMPDWPHAQSYGKQLRVLHLARALKQVGEVTMAIVPYWWAVGIEDAVEAAEKTKNEFHVDCTFAVKDRPRPGWRPRLRWWLDRHSLNPYAWVPEPSRGHFRESLKRFDLIWVNALYMPDLFGLWHWPRSVMDIDDIPSTYETGGWRNGVQPKRRLLAAARAVAWRRREKLLLERFTVLGVCSEADRQYLGGGERIHVIPNGFERPHVKPHPQPAQPPRLGFIGLITYPPNGEGVRWFIDHCWPLIKRSVPEAQLRLVGKGGDALLVPPIPDVVSLGWMEDPSEEIATWSAMIVPVRQGAGTRIKVVEAFARKCPLVSTRIGAFGYDAADGRELLIADTPDAFAHACIKLIRAPSEAAAMAERAWKLFLDKWTWDAVAPKVWTAADHCLRLNSGR